MCESTSLEPNNKTEWARRLVPRAHSAFGWQGIVNPGADAINRPERYFTPRLPLLSSSSVIPVTNAHVLITTHTIVITLNAARI